MADEGAAKRVSGSLPREAARPFLRRWLCYGRSARALWVCAAGEPEANLQLTVMPEATWPAFLTRTERRFLDVQVRAPARETRWLTGFDSDPTALVARLAPECTITRA